MGLRLAPAFAWNGRRNLVTVGDSKTALGVDTVVSGANTKYRFVSIGYPHHLNGLLKQRLFYPWTNNVAVGGHTTSDQLAIYDAIAGKNPGLVSIECGTNDVIDSNIASTTTIANLQEMCRRNAAMGAYTLLSTISTRGIGTSSSAWSGLSGANQTNARLRLYQVNRAIKEVLGRLPGVFVANPNYYWTDPASSLGDPRATYVNDGLHDSVVGSYWRAKSYYEILNPLIPPCYSPGVISQADSYDATSNQRGSILLNGCLTGTGGTIGTKASGTAPDGWTAATIAGSATITATAQDRADGFGREFIFSASGLTGDAHESFNLTRTISGVTIAAGDTVYAEADVEVSTSQNLTGTRLILSDQNSGVSGSIQQQAIDGEMDQNDTYLPTEARSIKLRTPQITLLAGNTGIKLQAVTDFNGSNAQTFSVSFRNIAVFKVF